MKSKPHPMWLLLCSLLVTANAGAFYHPQAGRWLSRDPLPGGPDPRVLTGTRLGSGAATEMAFLRRAGREAETRRALTHTYTFLENQPVAQWDVLGLQSASTGAAPCCEAHDPKAPALNCQQVCQMFRDEAERGISYPTVICWGDLACPCLAKMSGTSYNPGDCPEIDSVIMAHEESHMPYMVCKGKCGLSLADPAMSAAEWDAEECTQRRKTLSELEDLTVGTAGSRCALILDEVMARIRDDVKGCPLVVP